MKREPSLPFLIILGIVIVPPMFLAGMWLFGAFVDAIARRSEETAAIFKGVTP